MLQHAQVIIGSFLKLIALLGCVLTLSDRNVLAPSKNHLVKRLHIYSHLLCRRNTLTNDAFFHKAITVSDVPAIGWRGISIKYASVQV